MFNEENYYLNIAISSDAILVINEEVSEKITNAKDYRKKEDLISETFLSIDRNFMGNKFFKKSGYINESKKKLKTKYGIKSSTGLLKEVERLLLVNGYSKAYLAVEMFSFFEKSGKKFKSLEEGIREYYNLIDLKIEEDMDELKSYYKKSFYILNSNRKLFNKNYTYALELIEIIDILKLGYIASYIKSDEVNSYLKLFGREISQRFDSWKSFYTSILLGLKLENIESDEQLDKYERLLLELVLNKQVSPYEHIKFRENPREDISKILELIN